MSPLWNFYNLALLCWRWFIIVELLSYCCKLSGTRPSVLTYVCNIHKDMITLQDQDIRRDRRWQTKIYQNVEKLVSILLNNALYYCVNFYESLRPVENYSPFDLVEQLKIQCLCLFSQIILVSEDEWTMLIFRLLVKLSNTSASNWGPRSDIKAAGQPYVLKN